MRVHKLPHIDSNVAQEPLLSSLQSVQQTKWVRVTRTDAGGQTPLASVLTWTFVVPDASDSALHPSNYINAR